ncbi:MAG TPA: TIGR01777 family oxidoreductase [Terriglobia bacterium]|nr:TIGR01777 family oxidoreductase [Terriglobia bacterium]
MRILMTGSSGFLGSALIEHLTRTGHSVVRLVRSSPRAGSDQIQWDPSSGSLPALPDNLDAAINLAGENIAARWTPRQKSRILNSRANGTRLLCRALADLSRPPAALVSASAIGFYGNRGDEVLSEESAAGEGFLPRVCREWERATEPASEKGIRVVNLRMAMVLSGTGGALAKMLPVFRMGLGGPIGTGEQYMSWIALDDLIGVVQHCLSHADLGGPVIAAAPGPVTNREFVKALGKVLNRPVLLRMPAWGARLAFGEMADEVLLASQRVEPVRLKSSGYRFQFPALDSALKHILTN